jgi:hypothetical protein
MARYRFNGSIAPRTSGMAHFRSILGGGSTGSRIGSCTGLIG